MDQPLPIWESASSPGPTQPRPGAAALSLPFPHCASALCLFCNLSEPQAVQVSPLQLLPFLTWPLSYSPHTAGVTLSQLMHLGWNHYVPSNSHIRLEAPWELGPGAFLLITMSAVDVGVVKCLNSCLPNECTGLLHSRNELITSRSACIL